MTAASLTDGRGRLFGGATALWAGQCLTPRARCTFEQRDWVSHQRLATHRGRARALRAPCGGALSDRRRGLRRGGLGRLRRQAARGRSRALVHQVLGLVPGAAPRPALPALAELVGQRAGAAACHRDRGGHHTTAGTGSSVRARDAPRAGRCARARACVLCGGGVENARLLLASNSTHRGGVGNAGDLVGRYFQDHPNGHAAVIHGRRVAPAGAVRPALPRPDPIPPAPGAQPGDQRFRRGARVRRPPRVPLRRGLGHRGGPARLSLRASAAARRELRRSWGGSRATLPAWRPWPIGGSTGARPGGPRAGDPSRPRRAGSEPRQPRDPVARAGTPRQPLPRRSTGA